MPKGQTRFKTFDTTTTVVSVFLPTTTAYRTRGASRNSRPFHLRKDSHQSRWTRTLNLRLRFVILLFKKGKLSRCLDKVADGLRRKATSTVWMYITKNSGVSLDVFISRRKPVSNPSKVVTGGGGFGASLPPCTSTQNR